MSQLSSELIEKYNSVEQEVSFSSWLESEIKANKLKISKRDRKSMIEENGIKRGYSDLKLAESDAQSLLESKVKITNNNKCFWTFVDVEENKGIVIAKK